ncbi:MAG TPA: hypothetical protein VGX78_18420 [Pirellulales bacterium]|nr:hypothetical protein [Pirellulales bacterium]
MVRPLELPGPHVTRHGGRCKQKKTGGIVSVGWVCRIKARQAAGDGRVRVGDAFGFLARLYSSGVILALKSSQLAAVDGLAIGETAAAQPGRSHSD